MNDKIRKAVKEGIKAPCSKFSNRKGVWTGDFNNGDDENEESTFFDNTAAFRKKKEAVPDVEEIDEFALDEKHRNWCYTYNNYTNLEVEILKNYKCTYHVFGFEFTKSGKPHLQGYIEFANAKAFGTLKKAFPKMHLGLRKGTSQQASNYCKKGVQSHEEWEHFSKTTEGGHMGPNYGKNADIFEIGTRNKQGDRSDLEAVAELVSNRASLKEIAEKCPVQFMKYSNGIEKLRNLTIHKHRSSEYMPQISWYWGASGSRKTFTVLNKHGEDNVYIKDGTKWWSEYDQEEAILMDDYDGNCPFRILLRLLDRNKISGETKGGSVKINSPFIYITCEYPPEHFYKEENELRQVMRRIFESGGDCIGFHALEIEKEEGHKKADNYVKNFLSKNEYDKKCAK